MDIFPAIYFLDCRNGLLMDYTVCLPMPFSKQFIFLEFLFLPCENELLTKNKLVYSMSYVVKETGES